MAAMPLANEVMRLAGTRLLGSGSRITPEPAGFGRVVAGSKMGWLLRKPKRLKSPSHCCAVGTFAWPVLPLRILVPSHVTKKNVRLRMIGPPKVPPNKLYRKGDF